MGGGGCALTASSGETGRGCSRQTGKGVPLSRGYSEELVEVLTNDLLRLGDGNVSLLLSKEDVERVSERYGVVESLVVNRSSMTDKVCLAEPFFESLTS